MMKTSLVTFSNLFHQETGGWRSERLRGGAREGLTSIRGILLCVTSPHVLSSLPFFQPTSVLGTGHYELYCAEAPSTVIACVCEASVTMKDISGGVSKYVTVHQEQQEHLS